MVFDALSKHQGRTLSMDVFRTYINKFSDSTEIPQTSRSYDTVFIVLGRMLSTLKESGRLLVQEALSRAQGNQVIAAHMAWYHPPRAELAVETGRIEGLRSNDGGKMERIECRFAGFLIDFEQAKAVAKIIALPGNEFSTLVSWSDREKRVHSPQCLQCEIKDEPGWEVYGRNHEGRLRISFDDDRFVFIFS